MSILVTGCAGFIGSNLVNKFKKQYPRIEIVGVDDFSTGRKEAVAKDISFYEGSILNKRLIEKIFSKHEINYVFHFAALPRVTYSIKHPRLTSEVNIVGTVALLEASAKHNVKRFIYSSSSSIYGESKKLPTKESENQPDPKSPYAVEKYAGEPFCKVFSEIYHLDTVSLRYFNVYGPGQYGDAPYSTVIASWLESIYFPSKSKAFIEGDGSKTRDFCYVDNVVMANILAMRYPKKLKGEAFNVAHGKSTSINKVYKLILELTGKQLVLERRPPRVGDVPHTLADINKSKKILGYKPKYNFKDGLRLTIDWYEDRKKKL
jgi:nucleoside-diphosphate-sugar epimerase